MFDEIVSNCIFESFILLSILQNFQSLLG